MSEEFIHIHNSPLNRNHNIFLLFIPIIVFALLIAFLFSAYSKGKLAGISKPDAVLGTQNINP